MQTKNFAISKKVEFFFEKMKNVKNFLGVHASAHENLIFKFIGSHIFGKASRYRVIDKVSGLKFLFKCQPAKYQMFWEMSISAINRDKS